MIVLYADDRELSSDYLLWLLFYGIFKEYLLVPLFLADYKVRKVSGKETLC